MKWLLYGMVFLVGACVLILEILGTYLLAPFFGTSLYVWSSLITTTLIFLSIGYGAGGYLADRLCKPSSPQPYTGLIILLAFGGITTGMIPFLREWVFRWTFSYGIEKGSLFAAAILFSFPMITLGMITPYTLKLLNQTLEHTGRTAGSLFFYSTVGSVLGSLSVVHFLLPRLETASIVFLVAFTLIALACLLSLLKKRAYGSFTVLLGSFVLFYALPSSVPQEITEHKIASSGKPVDIVWKPLTQTTSFYGQIQVWDRIEYGCANPEICRVKNRNTKALEERRPPKEHTRLLLVNNQIQSGMNWKKRNEPESYPAGFHYTRFLYPEAKSALCIGVAGGVFIKFLLQMGFEVDAVEIDPSFVAIAHDYFEVPQSSQLHFFIEDGRTFLERTSKEYDVIFLDAFTNYTVPPHLCTQEFFRRVHQKLHPKGVFAMNVTCFADGDGQKTWMSVASTLASVFGKEKMAVYVFLGEYQSSDEHFRQTGNYVYFATKGEFLPKPLPLEDGKPPLTVETPLSTVESPYYRSVLASLQTLLKNPCAWISLPLLTDEWNPVEYWQKEANHLFRQDFLNLFLPSQWKF
ncbi:MAG: fused MFS/spermidine synthase [Planctomycetota bacterium]